LLIASLVPVLVATSPAEEINQPAGSQMSNDAQTTEKVKEAVSFALQSCQRELETWCSTVTPGENRLRACLMAHADKLSEPCSAALGVMEQPDLTPRLRYTKTYPTLEDRDLGNPYRDEEGRTVVWDRALPFLAQNVVDLGFDLPKPYGVSIIPAWIRQDLVLEDLSISVNNGPVTPIPFVDFGSPEAENKSIQVKFDAWLFPFMNVFATVGWFEGKGTIPLKIEGRDLFSSICAAAPTLPICVRTYSAIAEPEYDGKNITLGINLAVGWDRFFFALPVAYAWSDVSIVDTTVTALNISPRFGVTGDVGDKGVIATFVGVTYLSAEVDLAGTVAFDTPGAPGGDTTTVDFRVKQRNKDPWNFLLGFNWDISKTWSVMAESGPFMRE